MEENIERAYWMQLFANLLNASPVDTRNMVTHIVMFENADEYVIEVNAPYATNPKVNKENVNGYSDYAYAVNYANRSPHKGWIQNQITHTARLIGARITYLGGE